MGAYIYTHTLREERVRQTATVDQYPVSWVRTSCDRVRRGANRIAAVFFYRAAKRAKEDVLTSGAAAFDLVFTSFVLVGILA